VALEGGVPAGESCGYSWGGEREKKERAVPGPVQLGGLPPDELEPLAALVVDPALLPEPEALAAEVEEAPLEAP
jgi:hypothetical protein